MVLAHRLVWLLALSLLAVITSRVRAADEFPIPEIPGLTLTREQTVEIKQATHPIVFRFNDGRICMNGRGAGGGICSDDGGKTWRDGPAGPLDKMAIDLGDGEILSIDRDTVPRADGKLTVKHRRSSDNWKTVQAAEAVADVPLATSSGGDTGEHVASMLMHHGIVKLKNGDVLATLYGNYKGDRIPYDAYPPEFRAFKHRTVVIRSADRGKTWGDPRTVAYDTMLGALNEPDIAGNKLAVVPAVTQEGFSEADLAVAPSGDIICVMRSGGASGEGVVTIFPTPLYVSRSSDDGKTWTPPVGIADRGTCPSLVTLANGIIVCCYSRPGAWVIFSDDNGVTWKGATQFAPGKKYCYIVAVGADRFMTTWERDGRVFSAYFTVRATPSGHP